MMDLFAFASNDKSLEYLHQIFGSMNGIIPAQGGAVGASVTLLGTMFKTFNSIILSIAVLVVAYITVIGVMKTAHEGEVMGKGQWSSLWIPIRIVLGVAALVPTGSGFSGLQIIMMWFIVQGVGAADTIWNTALNYVDVAGSPTAQVTIPSVSINQAMNNLFEGIVCDTTARMQANDSWLPDGGKYYCSGKTQGYCSNPSALNQPDGSGGQAFNESFMTYVMGPGKSCGSLSYCNSATVCNGTKAGSLECAACKGQIEALKAIISNEVFLGIAQQFVNSDYTYRQFYNTSSNNINNPNWTWIYDYCRANSIPQNQCCKAPTDSAAYAFGEVPACQAPKDSDSLPSPDKDGSPQNPSDRAVKEAYWPYAMVPVTGSDDFIQTAVSYYMNMVTGAVTTYIAAQPTSALSDDLKNAQKTGWILAGGYYYTIAGKNSNNLTEAMPTLTSTPGDFASNNNQMSGYRNNYDAAGVLAAAASGQGDSNSSLNSLSSIPKFNKMTSALKSTMDSSADTFTTTIKGSKGTNPLAQLQMAGASLLMIVQVAYPALLYATYAIGAGSNINVWALGTGGFLPLGPAVTLMYFLFAPMLYALLGILVTLGGLLGVYVPLIPYVIFTFGAIGWLLSTIETMVAGPLVALGILSPGAQSELFGRAEPALMLILNVFLRPSLMIFGLMASMLLASVVVTMINTAFWGIVAAGIAGMGVGTDESTKYAFIAQPLSFAIFLAAYVSLIVAALNKCFAAIYLVPQQVLRWIGGQPESYGEAEALGEVKRGAEAGAEQTAGAVRGGRGAVEGAMKQERKAGADRAKAKENQPKIEPGENP